MKQDWEEEAIRQLFRDERREGVSTAPHFSATLEAAVARRQRAEPRRLSFRIAFAIVLLLAVIGGFRVFTNRSAKEHTPIAANEPGEPDRTPAPVLEGVTPWKGPPPKTERVTRRHRRATMRTTPLISQWRSPTEFLLRTPGDQLLKTVPSVGTSTIEIKVNFSDQKN